MIDAAKPALELVPTRENAAHHFFQIHPRVPPRGRGVLTPYLTPILAAC
jgi:hypothetical protein